MQKVHLSLLVIISFLLYLYCLAINQLKETTKKILSFIVLIFIIGLVGCVFILPVDVIIFDGVLDVGGLSYEAAMVGILFDFISILILIVLNLVKDKGNFKKSIPFIVFLVFFIFGFLLRLHFPELITESYIVAFVLLVMYFTMENPDVKMLNQVELAKNQAEKANTAKTDFLSSMSHEIRTPLNAIVGFSNAILEEDTMEAAKEDAKDIILASENLLEIVNGILDISKIEANKMEIINGEYNLKEECETLVKLVKPRIGEKQVELRLSLAPDIPDFLYGDKGKMKEVITNLLTNAVKYTDEGVITFSVNCINKNDESSLVVSVEDTGRGIKPEKIDKLFNKFERLEEDKNTTIEGVGLGLAITKKLVEMLGGRIVVQSVFGSGSKFTFYIKQKIVEKKVKEFEKEEAELLLTNKRVLLVDDNALNIKVAERLFKGYGLIVESCTSGDECLYLLKAGKTYDLIFMDDMMPKLSGTETLHLLQEIPEFDTRVIALTANAIEGMRDKYIKEGFADYLAKPIEKIELERVFRKYLNNEKKSISFAPLPQELYEITDDAIKHINDQ